MNKINGRTPEEIKKGLAICGDPEWDYCRGCPFEDDEDCIEKDRGALAYIQQLEAERDAAVKTLRDFKMCADCNHKGCADCRWFDDITRRNKDLHDNWQWRGVQEVG